MQRRVGGGIQGGPDRPQPLQQKVHDAGREPGREGVQGGPVRATTSPQAAHRTPSTSSGSFRHATATGATNAATSPRDIDLGQIKDVPPLWTDAVIKLSAAPVVSVAKIRGRARGGGDELLLACDIRYARHGAELEVNLGPLLGDLA
ncbi:hypothetical protein ACFY36_04735 [Actinoplanes sp. NPDC000266]